MTERADSTESIGRGLGRAVILLHGLFFLSGLAALVYQVMWARNFGLVFGSTTRAASAVLSAFFLGMAIGNWLGGHWARERRRSLYLYAVAEVVVAVGALLVLFWTDLYRANYPALYESWLGGAGGLTVLQLLLAFGAMCPPCIAMGTTLPLMSRVLVARPGHLGRRVGFAYAVNTAGATVGVLLSGFVLPLWTGTRNGILVAVALNVVVAVGALAIWRWTDVPGPQASRPRSTPGSDAGPEAGGSRVDPALWCVAALSGFASLALEVLYLRLLLNWADGSVHSFAVILAIFLIALALGAAAVSFLADRVASPWKLVAWPALFAALAIALSHPLFLPLVSATRPIRMQWSYLGWLFGFTAILIGPSVVLAGMALPACWKLAARSVHQVGQRVGRLTAVNTLAGVLGSLVAGFLVLPWIGLRWGFSALAVLYLSMAWIGWMRGALARRWAPIGAALLVLGAPLLVERGGFGALMLRQDEAIVRYHESEAGSVAVTELANGVRKLRLNNVYTMASSAPAAIRSHRNQARLALDAFGEPRSVAFIGFGAGLTASAATEYASLRRIVAMEIIPGVIDAAEAFAESNRGILRHPALEMVAADGRNHLYGRPERFDVIVGDLFATYHAGTGYLYTREHFAIVADRLNEGGVFAQFFQGNEITLEELRIISATFLDVFEDAELWLNRTLPATPSFALVGRASRLAGPTRHAPSPAAERDEFLLLCGTDALHRWADSAPRNTDDHPIVEFMAASSYLRRAPGDTQRAVRFLRRTCAVEARREGAAALVAP